jgi:elongation factor P
MIATDLKTGKIFKEDGYPYQVVKYEFTKTARAGATVKVKARNLVTGSVLEKGYLGSFRVEEADITRKNAQYLYKENGYVFMDPNNYEQFTISQDIIGDQARFLMDGANVIVMYFEDKPISVDLPITLDFEVSYTEPGYKGNTVSNVLKEATLDNGAVIKVPTFIKIGDRVKIDTRSGDYVSRQICRFCILII